MSDQDWIRPGHPLVIAHRGHSLECPENTLAAYRQAIRLGADMIEADVNMTSDGVLVMIHDWTLDRTTDGSGPVRERTLEQVRALDAGSWFSPEFHAERVPTTVELIELAREGGVMLCLEVKGADEDEAATIGVALAELLAERGALDWAFASSYFHGALRAARTRVPALLLAPERLPDDVPADPPDAVRQALALGAPVIQNHYAFLTPALVGALHEHGIAVWSWPTTERASIVSSFEAGADAVMGDDVDAMRLVVDNHAGVHG